MIQLHFIDFLALPLNCHFITHGQILSSSFMCILITKEKMLGHSLLSNPIINYIIG